MVHWVYDYNLQTWGWFHDRPECRIAMTLQGIKTTIEDKQGVYDRLAYGKCLSCRTLDGLNDA